MDIRALASQVTALGETLSWSGILCLSTISFLRIKLYKPLSESVQQYPSFKKMFATPYLLKLLILYVYVLICMVIEMAKNIALAEDVYRDLKRMKREGESFSDLIRRLLKTRGAISDLAESATLSTEEWLEMKRLKEEQAALDESRTDILLSKQEG
ncbi:MAG: hypothetical protein BAJATHORv1_90020 [Candidatus Thorarchaeota archaeon]|nr:MAG: hypothetical protein BAJATHORv1_90020 [Candidatus Thorarchaeota archaeon]